MKRILAASVLSLAMIGTANAHNNWLAPVVTGVAIAAVVAGASHHYRHHNHHYNSGYGYVAPQYVAPHYTYVPQVPVYVQPPLVYQHPEYPGVVCHASYGYCYQR